MSTDSGDPIAADTHAQRMLQRYLIAINLPIFCDAGKRYVDELWFHDLSRHLDYIEHLTLFCPVVHEPPPPGFLEIPSAPPFDRLSFIEATGSESLLKALVAAPCNVLKAWRAVGSADIVHSGPIGWPIPLGYYCAPAAALRGRFHISVMESSPWRAVPGERPSLSARVRAAIMEWAARRISRRSELALFTTADYLRSMVPPGARNAHVFKASWITQDRVISEAEHTRRWNERLARSTPDLCVGFAARLTVQKGCDVLAAALQQLDPALRFEIRILGEGERRNALAEAARMAPQHVVVKMLGKVEYGDPFFATLDDWDVTLVPSLSEEQPRIVYDSFARGIPVVCSNTRALAECVNDGRDGVLFSAGDARALAERLNRIARDRQALREMGSEARRSALLMTHERMHADRRALIEQAWRRFCDERAERHAPSVARP